MFSSFTSALEDCNITLGGGDFHLITETPYISANAIISYYLLKCLKDKPVCFIALQNSWSHYCNIGNKLGVNLRSKTQEQLRVLDSFKELSQLLNGDEKEKCFTFLTQSSDFSLKKLYFYIKSTIQQFSNGKLGFAIIIDSLNPLLHMGVEAKDIAIFIHYCKNLTSNSNDLLVASCSLDEMDLISKDLVTNLYHMSSTILKVKNLPTGKSKDIHGELMVFTCSNDYKFKGYRKCKKFHFKNEERDIRIFSPGLASKIL